MEKTFKQFIETIKPEDEIGILHHVDADGLCSAVITAKALERLGKSISLRLNQRYNQIQLLPETIEKLKGITKLFILDLAVHQDKEAFGPLEEFCETAIIDHHKPMADLNSKQTLVIQPADISKKKIASFNYPTSKMCFDLFSSLVDIKDLSWIAIIGILGDCCEKYWPDFINSENELKNVADIIDSALIYDESLVEECFKILMQARNPKDIIHSELSGAKLVVDEELNKWVNQYQELAETGGKLVFYIIKPAFEVCSKIATRIWKLNPDKTIVVIQDLGREKLTISARSNYLDISELLRTAIKSLDDATAGGHKVAAGGRIRKEDLERFKEKLMELIE